MADGNKTPPRPTTATASSPLTPKRARMSSPDRAVEKPEKEKNSMAEEKVEKQEPVSSNSAAVPEASSTELPAEQDEEDDYLEAVCCRRPHRQWNTD